MSQAPTHQGGAYKGTKGFEANPPAKIASQIVDHSMAGNLEVLKEEGTGYTPCGTGA